MLRTSRILLAFAVAGAATLAVAAPASAHDELLTSSPAAGERLAAAPTEVTLTYSADVLAIGAAVVVADSAGHDWVVSDPVSDGATVTVAVDPAMPDAGYEVRWRVVSADGHPISGLIPFTVGDGQPLVREEASTPAQTADAASAPASEGDGALRIVLIGAGGAACALAVFALITILRRRKAPTS